MFRKFISLVLCVSILVASCGAQASAAQQKAAAGEQEKVEKIRRKVYARGTGERARVTVKLSDGTKIKGYVSEASADHFTVLRTDDKFGSPVRVSYGDVTEVKARGKGHSTASKVLISAGVTVAVTAGILALMFRNFRLNIR